MSGQWNAGDVAMVTGSDGRERLAIWTGHATTGRVWLVPFSNHWDTYYGCQVKVRPLVVIDPEDAESIKRLVDLYRKAHIGTDAIYPPMFDALREFANPTPPKPDEPLGLGAVVELADGRQAVRTFQPVQPWSHFKDGLPFLDRWQDIDAVTVLSEGVAP